VSVWGADAVTVGGGPRPAGIPVACVSYGYNEGRDPHTLDGDALLDSLAELPALLESNSP
jgi:phosphoglycolate phosphatase-like HAD superfamily hydrolase